MVVGAKRPGIGEGFRILESWASVVIVDLVFLFSKENCKFLKIKIICFSNNRIIIMILIKSGSTNPNN